MSALEQEIIERLKHLSHDAQLRVLEVVKQAEEGVYDDNDELEIVEDGELDGEEWLAGARALREHLEAKYGREKYQSAAELIREIREEES